jgi:chromosome segregation ATPase
MNKYGEYVSLFLASQNYNEGIDLKAVRHIHIFEPLITWASDKQTIGRAARYCSHIDLDKKEWDVNIHRYISDLPNELSKSKSGSSSSINSVKKELDELLAINFKQRIKDNKEKIKENTKKLKTLNKKPDINAAEIKIIENENDDLLNNVKIITSDEIKVKERIKTLKAEYKKLEKKAKANEKKVKNKVDATDIINIDEFIYKQSQEKMKQILTLYQYMKEAAIDCQVLNEFHKSGNQTINCHRF